MLFGADFGISSAARAASLFPNCIGPRLYAGSKSYEVILCVGYNLFSI